MKRNLLSVLLLIISPLFVFSQLVVSPNGSATTLAQKITGSGVTVTNATLNCGSQASGTFTYTGIDLGISNGVLLTTGIASQAIATYGSTLLNDVNGNNFTDPNITAISSQATYDVCILKFDFVPICDTMKINFVFASDEYPKYINQFNDVFAMFLTGPKPSGGNYTAQDIAILPNGTPVEVNTVNAGWPIGTGASNPSFYVDNYPPDATATHNFDFYGYTVPVTSIVPVVPCSTYHMKIAVADAGNGHNDSGVFIKANSFTCQSGIPTVSTVNTSPLTCGSVGSAYVSITNYTGTSTYNWAPGGATTDSINNLAPGVYVCTVGLQSTCGAPYNQTVTVTIPSHIPPNVSAGVDQMICKGATVQLNATGASTYTWAPSTGLNSNTVSNPIASPTVSTTYTVTGTDNITGCTNTSVVTVNVNPINALINANPTSGAAPLTVQFINSSSPGNYTWNYGNGSTLNTTSNTSSSAYQNPGTYTVTMTVLDAAGCKDSATLSITVDEKITLFIPNVFSPNGDGKNDEFSIKSDGFISMHIIIYDRWGLKVWESKAVNPAWDGKNTSGKEMPDGTYYFILDATNYKNEKKTYPGYLLLDR